MRSSGPTPSLVPELDVTDLDVSRAFYVGLLGFRVVYERPAERFVYLACDRAEIMLEEAAGPGRRFGTAALARPFGRGVNFQLEVADVDAIYERIIDAGHTPVVPLEEQWYGIDAGEAGNRQFVVADPDGYLWRPLRDLGVRPRRS
jgi:catechol 2,3-dioxygenase-like lactoylglutathione lyase family enzyme